MQAQVSTIGIDMRTDLDHLPAAKQREIERVKAIIFEEFEDALILAQHEWKKKGKIEKIILYGSYARGGWVDEPHTAKDRKEHTSELQSRENLVCRLLLEKKNTAEWNTT